MREAVIVSAVRTAIGRQGGALASIPAHVFGAEVIKEALCRAKVTADLVDDVILGNVLSGGGNIARLTALQTGLFPGMPGLTVDRQCGSGINAINLAAQALFQLWSWICRSSGAELRVLRLSPFHAHRASARIFSYLTGR